MSRLRIESTPLAGCYVAHSLAVEDSRGFFVRLFCEIELSAILGNRKMIQINQSLTKRKGAIRGFHYQTPPFSEMKIIRCLKGKVMDVAVDIRKHSPTFLQSFLIELSSEEKNMVIIPEGFAHGFQTLEENCELLYLHTAAYSPAHERGILVHDPMLNIAWPLETNELSDRDKSYPLLAEDFSGVSL